MTRHDDDSNRERLQLALEAAGLDLWENDLVTGAIPCKASKTFAELGYAEHESAAYVDDIFSIVHPDDVANLKEAVHHHLTGKTAQYRCEFRLRAKNGNWVWYANYGRIMDRDDVNPGRRFIGVTFNIDERKRKEEELDQINQQLAERNRLLSEMNLMLEALATSDSLTGLANRRKFMENGEHEVQRALRLGKALSLLIVDIDMFKRVNDTWGHLVGDQVICAVSHTCLRIMRSEVDIVGRIGGEEFAILMPEADKTVALHRAKDLCRAVSGLQVQSTNGERVNCTISIGIATLAEGCTSFKQLLINADQALYQAKQAGRNCVRC